MARPVIAQKIEPIKKFSKEKDSEDGCVYKLFYGGRKYVIVKAKNIYQSLHNIQKGLNQYLKGYDSQRKPDNLYLYLYQYVEKNKGLPFHVEVMLSSDNGYQLLKMEQHLLKKARKDKLCLNNRVSAYIPQWNPEKGMFNWIKRNEVLNFSRYKDKA